MNDTTFQTNTDRMRSIIDGWIDQMQDQERETATVTRDELDKLLLLVSAAEVELESSWASSSMSC